MVKEFIKDFLKSRIKQQFLANLLLLGFFLILFSTFLLAYISPRKGTIVWIDLFFEGHIELLVIFLIGIFIFAFLILYLKENWREYSEITDDFWKRN